MHKSWGSFMQEIPWFFRVLHGWVFDLPYRMKTHAGLPTCRVQPLKLLRYTLHVSSMKGR